MEPNLFQSGGAEQKQTVIRPGSDRICKYSLVLVLNSLESQMGGVSFLDEEDSDKYA